MIKLLLVCLVWSVQYTRKSKIFERRKEKKNYSRLTSTRDSPRHIIHLYGIWAYSREALISIRFFNCDHDHDHDGGDDDDDDGNIDDGIAGGGFGSEWCGYYEYYACIRD